MKKSRTKDGFTLVELLATLLIVSLLGIIVTTGTSAAIRIYNESLDVSESGRLTNILTTALSDRLRWAHSPLTDSNGTVLSFTDDEGGSGSLLALDGNGMFTLNGVSFLPPEVYVRGLKAALHSGSSLLTYTDGVFTVDFDIQNNAGTIIKQITLKVKCINS